jgi:uncharacterized protein YdeI (BOF family)
MQKEYKKHGFFSFSDSRNRELRCLKHGESEIDIVCRVLKSIRREIRTTEGSEKVILNGVIADDTAQLPFIAWDDREELATDRVVHIENGYVKKWKGMATVYIGKKTRITETNSDFPSRDVLMKPKKRTIAEVIDCEGAFDVIVEGDIVSSEGENTWILDDGTGALVLVLREKENDIGFGMPVEARGNVVESESGYVLRAEEVHIKSEESLLKDIRSFLCRYT